MATAPSHTASELKPKRFVERWFFTGMGLAMIATSLAAFLPSILHQAAAHLFPRWPPRTESYSSHGFCCFWSRAT